MTLTQYGYRLFAVELHHQKKQATHPFNEAKIPLVDEDGVTSMAERVVDYRKVIVDEVTSHAMQPHVFGNPVESPDVTGPAEARGTAMRFVSAELDGDAVRLQLQFGVRNADGTVMYDDPEEPDIDLRGKPTLYPYRAALVTAEDKHRGLLAVETRGKSCPVEAVVRGLHRISADNWRIRVLSNLASEAAMLDYLSRARVGKVVFDQYRVEKDGSRTRSDVTMSVRAIMPGVPVMQRAKGWVKDYFGFLEEYDPEEEKAAAEELKSGPSAKKARLSREERQAVRKAESEARKSEQAKAKMQAREYRNSYAAVAAETLKQDIFSSQVDDIAIDFNDVGIELDDGQMKKTIKPTSDFSRFTYFLGHGHVPNDDFYEAAEASAVVLLEGIQKLKLKR